MDSMINTNTSTLPAALLDSITGAALPSMQWKHAVHESAFTVSNLCYVRYGFRWLFLLCFVVGCLSTLSAQGAPDMCPG